MLFIRLTVEFEKQRDLLHQAITTPPSLKQLRAFGAFKLACNIGTCFPVTCPSQSVLAILRGLDNSDKHQKLSLCSFCFWCCLSS